MKRSDLAVGVRLVSAALLIVALVAAGTAPVVGGAGELSGVTAPGIFDGSDDPTSAPGASVSGTPIGDAGVVAATDDEDAIRLRNELFLTDEAGTVGVTTRARVPDRVTELEVTVLSANDEPIAADGFERAADSDSGATVWAWDGETAAPSLTYAMDANDTVEEDGPLAASGTYRFVDAGDWALVQAPRIGASWSYTGEYDGQVRLDRENVVAGEGAASQSMAFLGEHEEHVHEADGQRYRLIVPDAADPAASPAEVFDAFDSASAALRVGALDDEVFAVAAPTGEVSWAVRGLQTGNADLWVRDVEPAGTADDVWTHEYVHTRQAFRTETSGRWITEASATYYAALFALDRGEAGFDEFERTLARGEREPDASAVLADPGTWEGNADYTKGALLAGEIDRRLRLATDGGASLATVVRDLNEDDERITNERILDAVESAAAEGGDDEVAAEIRADAERLTTTREGAETWDREAHADAFGETPSRVGYGLDDDGVRATGEYRDRPVARDPVELVAGETLALSVIASNTGGVAGTYDLSLTVDGEVVETRNGTLDAGDERVERFERTFTNPGEYAVRIGGETLTVVVSEPAPVLVRGVSTDRDRVTAGESVRVTATVGNDATIPAGSDVEISVDGETVETVPVRLDAAAEETIERTVTLGDSDAPDGSDAPGGPGEVTVRVAGPADAAETVVTVERDGPLGDVGDDDGVTDGGVPGFGPGVALASLCAAAALLAGRAER
ncbi:hypothetical protein [Halorubrum trueperi]|uniref:PGF-CTERM sorting domain-containing protein n=1 Tax=Halorubrum trueperi TaxID=2004704 RepID=A0ABD5UQQ4_9EURY